MDEIYKNRKEFNPNKKRKIDQIFKNIEEFNPNKKSKILIVFSMIADTHKNETNNKTVTGLFIRGRKLNICCFYHAIIF